MFLAQRTAGPERTSFGLGAAEKGLSAGMGKSGREEAGEAGRGPEGWALWGPALSPAIHQSLVHTKRGNFGGQVWRPVNQCESPVQRQCHAGR